MICEITDEYVDHCITRLGGRVVQEGDSQDRYRDISPRVEAMLCEREVATVLTSHARVPRGQRSWCRQTYTYRLKSRSIKASVIKSNAAKFKTKGKMGRL